MIFDITVITDNIDVFARGYLHTILLLVIAIPISLCGAICVVLMNISRWRVVWRTGWLFVEIIRNIPFLIQAFLIFYGLPFYGVELSAMTAGVLCLTLYGTAYLSEAIRGAIQSVPKGQFEAADALALSYLQKMRYIIAPQLPRYLIPASANVLITMGKETALLSIITVPELTYMSQSIIGKTFAPVEVFTVLTIMYWFTSECLAQLMIRLEKRFEGRYTVQRVDLEGGLG